jgi:hypothetical protein
MALIPCCKRLVIPPIYNFRVDVPVPVPVLFSAYANEILVLAFILVDVFREIASRSRCQKKTVVAGEKYKVRYSCQ